MKTNCIIIGASHAASELAPHLRKEGWQGNIIVIGDELHLPYHRPPLSKAFMAGEKEIDELLIRKAVVYDKFDITFMLGTRVEKINREQQLITLDNGEQLHYDKLALCTGARARRATIKGGHLTGIHYLRNIDDVERIKQSLKSCKNIVIVGGGYIGLETAAVLNKLGMNVTILEMAPRILERVTASELSEFYTRIHTEAGVTIHCSVSVTEFTSNNFTSDNNPQVAKVHCADGRSFAADLVIIGIGVIPNTELAADAGLTIENGIVVNASAQTNDPNIVAVGDCSNHPNKLLDRRLRLESVPNAIEQARVAAATICGTKKEYHSIPWFWSDQYDVKLQISGLNQGYDQVIIRGDRFRSKSFVAFYLKEGKLIAADCINRPKEFVQVKQILTKGLTVDIQCLADESIDPKEFIKK